jgi:hypothetical protein
MYSLEMMVLDTANVHVRLPLRNGDTRAISLLLYVCLPLCDGDGRAVVPLLIVHQGSTNEFTSLRMAYMFHV